MRVSLWGMFVKIHSKILFSYVEYKFDIESIVPTSIGLSAPTVRGYLEGDPLHPCYLKFFELERSGIFWIKSLGAILCSGFPPDTCICVRDVMSCLYPRSNSNKHTQAKINPQQWVMLYLQLGKHLLTFIAGTWMTSKGCQYWIPSNLKCCNGISLGGYCDFSGSAEKDSNYHLQICTSAPPPPQVMSSQGQHATVMQVPIFFLTINIVPLWSQCKLRAFSQLGRGGLPSY